MIRVIIINEVKLYRDGLAQVLNQTPKIHVVATAARPCHLEDDLRDSDTVLLDVATARGITTLAGLSRANPGLRLVALGVSESLTEIIACVEAGASGYVTRDSSIAELVTTVETVVRDELTCPPRIAAALVRRVAVLAAALDQTSTAARLSRRETEIAGLIADELTNKEIASRLVISLATVKNHVHSILDKLEVRRRQDVAAWIRGQRLSNADTSVRDPTRDVRVPEMRTLIDGDGRWAP